jgi:hypothetical protein
MSGGLEVAEDKVCGGMICGNSAAVNISCTLRWLLLPAISISEAVGFFERKNPQHAFLLEGK